MKKVVIVAPFWRQSGHVGNTRVDRFVRWLSAEDFTVVLVRAGSESQQRVVSWGTEITVKDPLGIYRDSDKSESPAPPTRKPNKLRRWAARWLLSPDPGVLWARLVSKDRGVLEQAAGASLVLSSSPPESGHVAAAALAGTLSASLIVDMRDGWLDEPLKPLLRTSRLQRWRESRLERSVLRRADKILVTSAVWKSMLERRLPFTSGKTIVLTNAYPVDDLSGLELPMEDPADRPITLFHAGRFTGSSLSRTVGHLLAPLQLGVTGQGAKGIVTLLGSLEPRDRTDIEHWQNRYSPAGWKIETREAVPRAEMLKLLGQADGLLLLSASQAAIPSKLFEYIPLGKPIFAATPTASAVWQIGKLTDQLFLTDYHNPDHAIARSFISACTDTNAVYGQPSQFEERVLQEIFSTQVLAA